MIRAWWSSKSQNKKQNWLMLALVICFTAGGFVEAYSWIALIGVAPALGMVYLEATRGQP